MHLHGGTLEVGDKKPSGAIFRAWFPALASSHKNDSEANTDAGFSVGSDTGSPHAGQLTNRAHAL